MIRARVRVMLRTVAFAASVAGVAGSIGMAVALATTNYAGASSALVKAAAETSTIGEDPILGETPLGWWFPNATLAHLFAFVLTASVAVGIFIALHLGIELFRKYIRMKPRSLARLIRATPTRAALLMVILPALFAVTLWDFDMFRFRSAVDLMLPDLGPHIPTSVPVLAGLEASYGELYALRLLKVGAWGYLGAVVVSAAVLEFSLFAARKNLLALGAAQERLAVRTIRNPVLHGFLPRTLRPVIGAAVDHRVTIETARAFPRAYVVDDVTGEIFDAAYHRALTAPLALPAPGDTRSTTLVSAMLAALLWTSVFVPPVEAVVTPTNRIVIGIDRSASNRAQKESVEAIDRFVGTVARVVPDPRHPPTKPRTLISIITIDSASELVFQGSEFDVKKLDAPFWARIFERSVYNRCTDLGRFFELMVQQLEGDPCVVKKYAFIFSDLLDDRPRRGEADRCEGPRIPPATMPFEKLRDIHIEAFGVPAAHGARWRLVLDRERIPAFRLHAGLGPHNGIPALPPPKACPPSAAEREARVGSFFRAGLILCAVIGACALVPLVLGGRSS